MVVLGDFNAVTGTNSLQGDPVWGPWRSGFPNENSHLFLSFRKWQNLSIAGSWLQRKDINRFSLISGYCIIRKEISQCVILLSTTGKLVWQWRVHHRFYINSGHLTVLATLNLWLKWSVPVLDKHFVPNLSLRAKNVLQLQNVSPAESQSTEAVSEQCFTSPPTQYRLYERRFYRSTDRTNSIKVLKEMLQKRKKTTKTTKYTYTQTIM